tara:strand:+ start:206 stop:481 length:276 start_codon:yes stop_codon:yes gene_type:complete
MKYSEQIKKCFALGVGSEQHEFFNGITLSLISPCEFTFYNYEIHILTTRNGWGIIQDPKSYEFIDMALIDVVRFDTLKKACNYMNTVKNLK